MRKPSDTSIYYTFWNLALKNKAEAEAWRIENQTKLSFWPEVDMIFPGFYRYKFSGQSHKHKHLKGQFLPVAIWIEQQIDANGELLNDEELLLKAGTWKTSYASAEDNMLGEFQLLMTWEKCRLHPVTQEMYDFAMQSYARESRYIWFDTPETKIETPPERVELADAPSLF